MASFCSFLWLSSIPFRFENSDSFYLCGVPLTVFIVLARVLSKPLPEYKMIFNPKSTAWPVSNVSMQRYQCIQFEKVALGDSRIYPTTQSHPCWKLLLYWVPDLCWVRRKAAHQCDTSVNAYGCRPPLIVRSHHRTTSKSWLTAVLSCILQLFFCTSALHQQH